MSYKILIIFIVSCIPAIAGIQFERMKQVPSDLGLSDSSMRLSQARLSKNLDLSQMSFLFNSRERFEIVLDGAERLFQQGMPKVPSLVQFFPNKEGYETEVLLKADLLEKSVGPVPLEKTPLVLMWGDLPFFKMPTSGLFPGTFLRTTQINGQTVANLFPVQQDLQTGETLVLKKGSLWVRYNPKEVRLEMPRFENTVSLIVTSRSLENSAHKLLDFQRNQEGLPTEILYLEDLRAEPMVEEALLPDGYKNGEDKNEAVLPYIPSTQKGYDYELAKKLIHYLQERMQAKGSALRYVTLLGTGQVVPPSYYFTLPATFGKKWGVTDQCYSSLNKCLEPRLAIGRIPISKNEEFDVYLAKANAYPSRNKLPLKELSLVAGKAFPNAEIYVGELGTLSVIQPTDTDWAGVNKIFRTKFNYSRKAVLSLATGETDSRFVYALDHGKGNQWFVEHEYVASNDIENALLSPNANTPVIVSVACSNAAFDQEVTKEPIFGNAKYGTKSVGQALLLAPGGAIAYWGEARPGVGNPVYQFDEKGNLDLQGTNYGLQLLEGFFEKYRKLRQGRLGDLVLLSQRAFAVDRGNNMAEEGNAWTYYITTLLGDPTLALPKRPDVVVPNLAIGASQTDFKKGKEFPLLNFDKPFTFNLKFSSPAPVDVTLFQWVESEFGSFMTEKIITEKKGSVGDSSVSAEFLPEDSYGTYFMRVENTVGVPRERQVWFKAVKE